MKNEHEKEVYFAGNNGEKLIPVHINKARDNEYFYNWSSDLGKWIQGDKIPENLQRMYNNPPSKSSYQ